MAGHWWLFLIGIVVCAFGPIILFGSFVGAASSRSNKGFVAGCSFMLLGLLLTFSEIVCWVLMIVGIIAAFMGK